MTSAFALRDAPSRERPFGMDVRAGSIFALGLVAASAVIALSFHPGEPGRFQVVDVGGHAYRLDTMNGSLELCFPSNGNGRCLSMPGPLPAGFRRVSSTPARSTEWRKGAAP